MYLATVLLLMLVLPVGATLWEHAAGGAPLLILAGKWFVFWAVGVRLFLAGLRQLVQPRFTARHIFGMTGDEALPLVSELGAANLASGVVGIASLAMPGFVLPAALAAAIFYGIAGALHVMTRPAMGNQLIALVSDLFVFLVLIAYLAAAALG